MAHKYFRAILTIVLLFSVTIVLAQGPPDPFPGRPPRPPGPPTPIDGGILSMFLLGAGYAIKKIRDQKKQ
jgi:hypothetical protein